MRTFLIQIDSKTEDKNDTKFRIQPLSCQYLACVFLALFQNQYDFPAPIVVVVVALGFEVRVLDLIFAERQ